MNKDEMQKNWNKERAIVANDSNFAGLTELKAFRDGKTLTNSARSSFLNCRRKYQYSYVYGLATRRPRIPFLVGQLFHDELDRMYTEGDFDPAAAKRRIGKACDKAAMAEGLTTEDSDNISMQRAIVTGAVNAYARRYLKEDLLAWEVISPRVPSP
jgi:hypothetical protein